MYTYAAGQIPRALERFGSGLAADPQHAQDSPPTSLDMIVPRMVDTEASGGFENFIGERRHNLREVREALERRTGRRRDNVATHRFSGRRWALG